MRLTMPTTTRRYQPFSSKLGLAVAATLLLASNAKSQTSTWVDPFGGNFSFGGSWTPFGAPTGSNALNLNFNTPDVFTYAATNDLTSLTMNALTFSNYSGFVGSGIVTIGGTGTL